MTTQPITLPESKRLIELEETVTKHKDGWIKCGEALSEIRDSKLYRSEYATFEEYCRGKWGWTRQHANKLILGVDAVKSLPANLETKVSNPQQAKELSKIPAPNRETVLTKAAATAAEQARPMTAKDIKQAAAPEPTAPEPTTEPPTNDSKWLQAVGMTSARNFFAGQVEDIVSDAIEHATVEQLGAVKLALEVASKKVARRVKEMQTEV